VTETQARQLQCLTQILEFIAHSSGLKRKPSKAEGSLLIYQSIDGKSLTIAPEQLEDVLNRTDVDGRDFIQVNFTSGTKILLTDSLIGFKPANLQGLDVTKLPKVVTTPDIISVFDAIQEALHTGEQQKDEEVLVLRKVFDAVVAGGEAIGFDLSKEKSLIARVPTQIFKANA
jgi:hypothetical protein